MIASKDARLRHLLRRAAYGYRPSEWERWSAMSEADVVKELVDYESVPDKIAPMPTDQFGNLITANDPYQMRRYWLYRLCETSRPLEEVMTLFWHGHFATSDYKVQNGDLEWRQNRIFRKHALGNFRDLLTEVTTDPAMLIWLDGNNSGKAAPNENYSRELMELFAMGVDGGYTETDVKEGAKAFTGWTYDGDRTEVRFNPDNHNTEAKTYLGHEGPWGAQECLDIIVRHPSTAKFISTKLFRFFVHDNPPPAEIDRLAKVFHASKFSIREVVRAILTSPEFYSEKAHYALVKGPVQYAVMLTKTMDLPYKWSGDIQNSTMAMGQELFNPPNVKGWRMGRSWINTNTMTARLNYAPDAINQLRYRGLVKPRVTAGLASVGHNADVAFGNPEDAVTGVWEWLMPGFPIPDETHKSLVAYMRSNAPKDANKDFYWNWASGVVELIVTCPEYQVA